MLRDELDALSVQFFRVHPNSVKLNKTMQELKQKHKDE